MSKLDTFKFKLEEIDNKIVMYNDILTHNASYAIKQKYGFTNTPTPILIISAKNQLGNLKGQRREIVKELKKEMQYLANQEILQQQALTEQAEAKARQEEERIRILQEQLLTQQNITEQEKQKIEQELAKAKVELEKAKTAKYLAEKGAEGDIASAKTLMGTWESIQGTNPWIIAGISVGALTTGIIIFAILK